LDEFGLGRRGLGVGLWIGAVVGALRDEVLVGRLGHDAIARGRCGREDAVVGDEVLVGSGYECGESCDELVELACVQLHRSTGWILSKSADLRRRCQTKASPAASR